MNALKQKVIYFFGLIVLVLAVVFRLSLFNEVGNDFMVYKGAVESFYDGHNPYYVTLKSFEDDSLDGNHGFSYPPGFLYILFFPYAGFKQSDETISFLYLYKIPVILADIGIGVLIFLNLKKHNLWAALLGMAVWLFNPYFVSKRSYVSMDPIPLFLLMLAFEYLEKSDVKSAFFYTLSVLTKTFPVILFFIFLYKSKNKLKFLAVCVLTFIICAIPFLSDVETFLKAALLVHSDRSFQGKPFLPYLSYLLKIEIIRVIPFKFYAFMSICIGWMFSIVKYMVDTSKEKIFESKLFLWLKSINGKYALSIFPFLGFYLLTPVLNKTYMLWWLPVFILGVFEIFKSSEWVNSGFKLEMSKRKYLAEIAVALPYLVILSFYAFYFWYLSFWGYGIHVDFKYY